jgi:hypothetical protein
MRGSKSLTSAKKPARGTVQNLRKGNAGNKVSPLLRRGNPVDIAQLATHMAIVRSVHRAAKACHMSDTTARKIMQLPEWPDALERALKKTAEQITQETLDSYKLSVEFVDKRVARKLDNHQTHERIGDLDFYRGAEVVYKRFGLIQPSSVHAIANGGSAAAIIGTTVKERYKSMWLLQKEQQLQKECEAEAAVLPPNATGTPNPTPAQAGA